MNYIKSLQAEVAEREAQRVAAHAEIDAFLTFLHGPKFIGTENGERKDWIATGDVMHWLMELRGVLASR